MKLISQTSGHDSKLLDEAARLHRAWPLPTERGGVQWSRLPVGALLKEAAREAANSSCFYPMLGPIAFAEGGAGEKYPPANSRCCLQDVRLDRAPRSPYFGKTRAAKRSVSLKHLHRFSLCCSLFLLAGEARDIDTGRTPCRPPSFSISATARLSRTSGCRFHHRLPDTHGDQMG